MPHLYHEFVSLKDLIALFYYEVYLEMIFQLFRTFLIHQAIYIQVKVDFEFFE